LSKEGLTPALCGNIQDSAGYFIHPTIVDNPPESSPVVQEERFAPILPMLRWSDEDNVIARANDTEMGLGRRYGAVI
jgi:acyl-CoA reductase-like NAD-dependent aldehyde dehydrogenase